MKTIKYPSGAINRWKRAQKESKPEHRKKQTKFNNHKVRIDDIEFDSKAEGAYYVRLKNLKIDFKVKESFEICPRFRLNGKAYAHRVYTPDFSIYSDGELTSVVDVKGGNATLTTASRLRMVLFMQTHQTPVVIAEYDDDHDLFNESIK